MKKYFRNHLNNYIYPQSLKSKIFQRDFKELSLKRQVKTKKQVKRG